MDSLWSVNTLERLVGLQIAQIYGPACAFKRDLTVRKVNVQQQRIGTQDCGLFAVAYATEICYGKDPAMATFEQSKMNNHLLQCLQEGKITRFPQTHKAAKGVRQSKSIALYLSLYCYCNMPENYDDMIECDCCKGWFHKSCAGIKCLTSRQVKQLAWLCIKCTKGSDPLLSPCAQSKPPEFLPKHPAKKHLKKKKVAAGAVTSIVMVSLAVQYEAESAMRSDRERCSVVSMSEHDSQFQGVVSPPLHSGKSVPLLQKTSISDFLIEPPCFHTHERQMLLDKSCESKSL